MSLCGCVNPDKTLCFHKADLNNGNVNDLAFALKKRQIKKKKACPQQGAFLLLSAFRAVTLQM